MMIRRLGTFFLDILQVLVFAVSIFLFIYLLILQPHKIKGLSMFPNFDDGEFLLTDKVSYRFGEPTRGDVVVFKAPPDDSTEFIKRVIGLPGDKVMVKNGRIFVNDKELKEPYLDPDLLSLAGNFATEGQTLTVPANQYFLLGDNRNHSFDSRNFGFIDRSKIVGKAWLLYWPLNKAGVVPKVNYETSD